MSRLKWKCELEDNRKWEEGEEARGRERGGRGSTKDELMRLLIWVKNIGASRKDIYKPRGHGRL